MHQIISINLNFRHESLVVQSDEAKIMMEFSKYYGAKQMKHVIGTFGLLNNGIPPNTIQEMVIAI